jgi:TatD DNase family protein
MTDVHCHLRGGGARELVIGEDFFGVHPWDAESVGEGWLDSLAERLGRSETAGVGEIGLDRLRSKTVPPKMREVFAAQLALAADMGRRVVLHGAKCWGEVAKACRAYAGPVPAFLFHGFSRSGGLIPEIAAMNGFISVGPAVLNDHAVNYRRLVAAIPRDRLLLETDRTGECPEESPAIGEVAAAVAGLLGIDPGELEKLTDENARRFLGEA